MAAAAAVVTLMAAAPKVEAHEGVKNEAQDDWSIFITFAVIFTFALFGFEQALFKLWNAFKELLLKPAAPVENDNKILKMTP